MQQVVYSVAKCSVSGHYWMQNGMTNRTLKDRTAELTVEDCEGFVGHLNKLPGNSLVKRERVQQLKSAWDWAIERELWEGKNPWTGLHKRVKREDLKPPRPFSKVEMQAIIGCFKDTEPSYAPYVWFLFATGCRTSEAIGLQWKHISEDCSSVWIGSTLTRGIRQGTKTKKVRTVTVPANIQLMLQDLKTSTPGIDGDSLVFHAPQGGPICDNNFRNRAWKPVLERLEIPHRKAYTTRSTFITHALQGGISPGAVAALVGNSAKVIYESYLGSIPGQSVLPDIL